jgi:hypothetical protein
MRRSKPVFQPENFTAAKLTTTATLLARLGGVTPSRFLN